MQQCLGDAFGTCSMGQASPTKTPLSNMARLFRKVPEVFLMLDSKFTVDIAQSTGRDLEVTVNQRSLQ